MKLEWDDDELAAAARSLHREWESPELWRGIRHEIAALEPPTARYGRFWSRPLTAWSAAAAAATLVFAAAAVLWLSGGPFNRSAPPRDARAADVRLLSEEALTEIERAEAQYARAIDALALKAASRSLAAPSPLAVNLRERLLVIDAAIAECRAEVERNPFNAHLRRHLLAIYQEKRRTLEQILEQQPNAL